MRSNRQPVGTCRIVSINRRLLVSICVSKSSLHSTSDILHECVGSDHIHLVMTHGGVSGSLSALDIRNLDGSYFFFVSSS